MIVEATGRIIGGASLTYDEAAAVMTEIMAGEPTPAQFGSFVAALRMKGETAAEIAAMGTVMREQALQVEADVAGLVDVVGTGGDGQNTFNVSTAAAFVVAGAGARVAKHGNRAATSQAGSADVLEALGVKIELAPEAVTACIREAGFGFMFAPVFHPAMKFAALLRREIGIPTVFNVLGPLTNPAGVRRQVLGVARPELVELMAGALARMGSEHALVVHGLEGLDELSIAGPSRIMAIRDAAIDIQEITPEDCGLERAPLSAVAGGDAAVNAAMLRAILDGEIGPRADIVLLNAAAAIVVVGLAAEIAAGVAVARESIASGKAAAVLDRLVDVSNRA
ncbi:MAG TPA: anthranilate phosphoribosyltransferase [Chloroflexota bacterium]|nr:anthranilate phosphoribosyltransferase [Chloroflexota bacterium]